MPQGPPDAKQMAYFLALSQVGLEMAAPVGVGALLDYYLGWAPWGVIVGAVLGLVGGLVHLVVMANRFDQGGQGPSGDKPP